MVQVRGAAGCGRRGACELKQAPRSGPQPVGSCGLLLLSAVCGWLRVAHGRPGSARRCGWGRRGTACCCWYGVAGCYGLRWSGLRAAEGSDGVLEPEWLARSELGEVGCGTRGAAGCRRHSIAGWGWRGVVSGVWAALNWGEQRALHRCPASSALASFATYRCFISMRCRFWGERGKGLDNTVCG